MVKGCDACEDEEVYHGECETNRRWFNFKCPLDEDTPITETLSNVVVDIATMVEKLQEVHVSNHHNIVLACIPIPYYHFKQLFYPTNTDFAPNVRWVSEQGKAVGRYIRNDEQWVHNTSLHGKHFELFHEMLTHYEHHLNATKDCWSSCSLTKFQETLSRINTLLDVGDSCCIRCSLTLDEMFSSMEQQGLKMKCTEVFPQDLNFVVPREHQAMPIAVVTAEFKSTTPGVPSVNVVWPYAINFEHVDYRYGPNYYPNNYKSVDDYHERGCDECNDFSPDYNPPPKPCPKAKPKPKPCPQPDPEHEPKPEHEHEPEPEYEPKPKPEHEPEYKPEHEDLYDDYEPKHKPSCDEIRYYIAELKKKRAELESEIKVVPENLQQKFKLAIHEIAEEIEKQALLLAECEKIEANISALEKELAAVMESAENISREITELKHKIAELKNHREYALKKHLLELAAKLENEIVQNETTLAKLEVRAVEVNKKINEINKALAIARFEKKLLFKKNDKYYEHKPYKPEYDKYYEHDKYDEPEYDKYCDDDKYYKIAYDKYCKKIEHDIAVLKAKLTELQVEELQTKDHLTKLKTTLAIEKVKHLLDDACDQLEECKKFETDIEEKKALKAFKEKEIEDLHAKIAVFDKQLIALFEAREHAIKEHLPELVKNWGEKIAVVEKERAHAEENKLKLIKEIHTLCDEIEVLLLHLKLLIKKKPDGYYLQKPVCIDLHEPCAHIKEVKEAKMEEKQHLNPVIKRARVDKLKAEVRVGILQAVVDATQNAVAYVKSKISDTKKRIERKKLLRATEFAAELDEKRRILEIKNNEKLKKIEKLNTMALLVEIAMSDQTESLKDQVADMNEVLDSVGKLFNDFLTLSSPEVKVFMANALTLTQLKELASNLEIEEPAGDKRKKETWIVALNAEKERIAEEIVALTTTMNAAEDEINKMNEDMTRYVAEKDDWSKKAQEKVAAGEDDTTEREKITEYTKLIDELQMKKEAAEKTKNVNDKTGEHMKAKLKAVEGLNEEISKMQDGAFDSYPTMLATTTTSMRENVKECYTLNNEITELATELKQTEKKTLDEVIEDHRKQLARYEKLLDRLLNEHPARPTIFYRPSKLVVSDSLFEKTEDDTPDFITEAGAARGRARGAEQRLAAAAATLQPDGAEEDALELFVAPVKEPLSNVSNDLTNADADTRQLLAAITAADEAVQADADAGKLSEKQLTAIQKELTAAFEAATRMIGSISGLVPGKGGVADITDSAIEDANTLVERLAGKLPVENGEVPAPGISAPSFTRMAAEDALQAEIAMETAQKLYREYLNDTLTEDEKSELLNFTIIWAGLNELEKKLHEAKAVLERADKKLHELTIKHDKLTATILQLDTFLHRCLNAEHKIKEIINKIKKNQIEFDKTLKKIAFIKKEIVKLQEDRKHAIKKHLFDVVKVIDEKILHLSLNLSKEETNLINIQNTLNEEFKTLAVDELKLKQILKKFAKIYKDKDYNEKYYEHKVYEPEYKHYKPEYKYHEPEYKHYFPFPDYHEPEYKHCEPEYKHYEPEYKHYKPEYKHYEPKYDKHYENVPVSLVDKISDELYEGNHKLLSSAEPQFEKALNKYYASTIEATVEEGVAEINSLFEKGVDKWTYGLLK